MRKQWMAAVVFCACLVPYAWGVEPSSPAQDGFLGRWVLDSKASTYPAGTCPREMTIEMTQEDGAVHYHSTTVPTQGAAFEVDYTAKYDGKPALVSGSRGILLPVSLTRESHNVVIATYSNGFATAATSRRTLSEGGKVLTIKTVSKDNGGLYITNIGVYRRVSSGASTGFDLTKANQPLPTIK